MSDDLTRITIFHSNDIHGKFTGETGEDGKLRGSMAQVAGLVAQTKKENPNTLYCIAGDVFQGSLIDSDYQGLSTIDILNPEVIALGGDEVDVDSDGRVSVNGLALEEPYATYCYEGDQVASPVIPGGALENPFADPDAPAPAQENPYTVAEGTDDMDYPLTVPEGSAFVLCDNRNNRLDSRSSRFGLVKEADIRGVARAIIWPVYRAGLLEVAPAVG